MQGVDSFELCDTKFSHDKTIKWYRQQIGAAIFSVVINRFDVELLWIYLSIVPHNVCILLHFGTA